MPTQGRGSLTHALVRINGSGATVAAKVTILGLLSFDAGILGSTAGETDIRDQWFVLGQLNGGATITATTKTTVSPAANDVLYAESLSHITIYDSLWALVTDFTVVDSITVAFVFEAGQ
mgnify:CR=1 FL=1